MSASGPEITFHRWSTSIKQINEEMGSALATDGTPGVWIARIRDQGCVILTRDGAEDSAQTGEPRRWRFEPYAADLISDTTESVLAAAKFLAWFEKTDLEEAHARTRAEACEILRATLLKFPLESS